MFVQNTNVFTKYFSSGIKFGMVEDVKEKFSNCCFLLQSVIHFLKKSLLYKISEFINSNLQWRQTHFSWERRIVGCIGEKNVQHLWDEHWSVNCQCILDKSVGEAYFYVNSNGLQSFLLVLLWTYTKPVFAVLDENIPHSSITIKETFDIFFSNVWR